jgi:hypothetical protein
MKGKCRLELPLDVWCKQCSRRMTKGSLLDSVDVQQVAFYAPEAKPVHEFTFPCSSCAVQLICVREEPEKAGCFVSYGATEHEPRNAHVFDDTPEEVRAPLPKVKAAPVILADPAGSSLLVTHRLERLKAVQTQLAKQDAEHNQHARSVHRHERQAKKRKRSSRRVSMPSTSHDDPVLRIQRERIFNFA